MLTDAIAEGINIVSNKLTTTTTDYVADYEFSATNASGNRVAIDMYPAEKKQHQSPTELLLSALSACSSVDLVQMLKKRRKTVTALSVEAAGVRREQAPRAFVEITMTFTLTSPDVKQAEFEKMGTLAATKYCSVAATLNVEPEHRFVLLRPEAVNG